MDGAYNDKNGFAGYGVSLICDGAPMAFSGSVVRYMKQLDITFSYSKAHSGNEWHNFANRLAREGCGLK